MMAPALLTRFRGHRRAFGGGVRDAKNTRRLFSRVPSPDGGVGPCRPGSDELAQEFEPSSQSIREWVRKTDLDEGRGEDELISAERDELKRLRREVRLLHQEGEILTKAAAWFARETRAPVSHRNRCAAAF